MVEDGTKYRQKVSNRIEVNITITKEDEIVRIISFF